MAGDAHKSVLHAVEQGAFGIDEISEGEAEKLSASLHKKPNLYPPEAKLMAKRITFDDVLAEIKDEEYLFPRGDVATICVLTLQNGRQVVGAVFGQTFDPEIGKAEARKKAIGEICGIMEQTHHLW